MLEEEEESKVMVAVIIDLDEAAVMMFVLVVNGIIGIQKVKKLSLDHRKFLNPVEKVNYWRGSNSIIIAGLTVLMATQIIDLKR